ncbi:MAG: hypothetical protein Q7S09_00510 [bacterium]|nr:hypothetical protein [bacterium]
MKTKKFVFYLIGPIEFLDDPDRGWREDFVSLFHKRFPGIHAEFINPVKASYLVGKTVLDNARYAAELKAARNWTELKDFMDKIWRQDALSVDRSGIIVMWARTEKELKEASASVGSIREMLRLVEREGRVYLICDTTLNMTIASTHFLHIVLSSGCIFDSIEKFFEHFEQAYGPVCTE